DDGAIELDTVDRAVRRQPGVDVGIRDVVQQDDAAAFTDELQAAPKRRRVGETLLGKLDAQTRANLGQQTFQKRQGRGVRQLRRAEVDGDKSVRVGSQRCRRSFQREPREKL